MNAYKIVYNRSMVTQWQTESHKNNLRQALVFGISQMNTGLVVRFFKTFFYCVKLKENSFQILN